MADGKNEFVSRLRGAEATASAYESAALQAEARALIPLGTLKARACATILANLIAPAAPGAPVPSSFPDALTLQLARWFKHEFFSWTNSPACHACGSATEGAGPRSPRPEELRYGASRVEAYTCSSCGAETRFPRYNDVSKLLVERRGRCGEWANAFTLCCRSVGLRARYVLDWSDHVCVVSVSGGLWSLLTPHFRQVDGGLFARSAPLGARGRVRGGMGHAAPVRAGLGQAAGLRGRSLRARGGGGRHPSLCSPLAGDAAATKPRPRSLAAARDGRERDARRGCPPAAPPRCGCAASEGGAGGAAVLALERFIRLWTGAAWTAERLAGVGGGAWRGGRRGGQAPSEAHRACGCSARPGDAGVTVWRAEVESRLTYSNRPPLRLVPVSTSPSRSHGCGATSQERPVSPASFCLPRP